MTNNEKIQITCSAIQLLSNKIKDHEEYLKHLSTTNSNPFLQEDFEVSSERMVRYLEKTAKELLQKLEEIGEFMNTNELYSETYNQIFGNLTEKLNQTNEL